MRLEKITFLLFKAAPFLKTILAIIYLPLFLLNNQTRPKKILFFLGGGTKKSVVTKLRTENCHYIKINCFVTENWFLRHRKLISSYNTSTVISVNPKVAIFVVILAKMVFSWAISMTCSSKTTDFEQILWIWKMFRIIWSFRKKIFCKNSSR